MVAVADLMRVTVRAQLIEAGREEWVVVQLKGS